MFGPKSMRHRRLPAKVYPSIKTSSVLPDWELSFEFDGSHLSTMSSLPSPSRSPGLASFALYEPPLGPLAGGVSGMLVYCCAQAVTGSDCAPSVPLKTQLTVYFEVGAPAASR